MRRRRPVGPSVPDRILANRAEVVEYRDDGFYKVVGDLDDPLKQTWWLRPQQMNGGKVGDIGQVIYVVSPTAGTAYFFKEATL